MDTEKDTESSIPAGQLDDINIPLVAVSVALFAALLSVIIVGLQACIYNYQRAETAAKTLPQDDPSTPLGAILRSQREELTVAGWARSAAVASSNPGSTAPSTGPSPLQVRRIPINRAMDKVIAQYALAQGTANK